MGPLCSLLFEETTYLWSDWLCLRVHPPSWKLKNPRAQRSHLGPVTPGWQRHWPVSSQSNDLEPNELQWQGTHTPCVLRPWVWDWKKKQHDCQQEAETGDRRKHAVEIPRQGNQTNNRCLMRYSFSSTLNKIYVAERFDRLLLFFFFKTKPESDENIHSQQRQFS